MVSEFTTVPGQFAMAPRRNAKGKSKEDVQENVSNEAGDMYISHPFPFLDDRPQSVRKGETISTALVIQNNSKRCVELLAVEITSSRPKRCFSLTASSSSSGRSAHYWNPPGIIEAGEHFSTGVSCTPKEIGLQRSVIIINVGGQRIRRPVLVLAEDEVSVQLGGGQPYSRAPRRETRKVHSGPFVATIPPPLPVSGLRFRKKLSQYPIPDHLAYCDPARDTPEILNERLSKKSYCQYFSTLLHLEELQMQEDIREYDMYNVTMRRDQSGFLILTVPGVAENRPSLLYRDQIFATTSANKDTEYQGYIYKVEAERIFLRFDNSFHRCHLPNLQYDVFFSFNRMNMRRTHQAVQAARHLPERFLFPNQSPRAINHGREPEIVLFNQRLNEEQLTAVRKIIECPAGSPPYVIFGPPGTGKTVTVIEAMLQVLKRNPNARILACAPSNAASDLLLQRLVGPIQQRQMFRLNAVCRPYYDVPSEIIPYCLYEEPLFSCPSVEKLLRYKVIISTYMSAASLYAEGLPAGHFTHIFLDEGGQGSEPETMIPIAKHYGKKTVVVLAGDPQQLGPVIRSRIAQKFGLGKSYLERLFEHRPYSLDGNTRQSFVTKLVRNYRSHPAILELPSRLFYNGELIPCAAEEMRSSFCRWKELPNKKFPVLFIGVEGCDEREGTSPSWFNRAEASKVVEVIKKLKDYRGGGVTGKDIGVITPYHQQVVKLKKALAAMNLTDLKVGSVEQFQGQERRVIIISTVRSSAKYEESDEKYNLGFLRNPKRFNVAITRAACLLVVIGNPYIIRKDTYWNELLQSCIREKSCIGCSPPKDGPPPARDDPSQDDFPGMHQGSTHDFLVGETSHAVLEGGEWPDASR